MPFLSKSNLLSKQANDNINANDGIHNGLTTVISRAARQGGASGIPCEDILDTASIGIFTACYGGLFFWRVRNTPKGATYFKAKKGGGLEVSSKTDFYLHKVT